MRRSGERPASAGSRAECWSAEASTAMKLRTSSRGKTVATGKLRGIPQLGYSGPRLGPARVAELVIRGALKPPCPRGRVGSSPTPGTASGLLGPRQDASPQVLGLEPRRLRLPQEAAQDARERVGVVQHREVA